MSKTEHHRSPVRDLLEWGFEKYYDPVVRQNYLPGVQFSDPPGDPGWFGPDSPVWYVFEHTPSVILGLFASGSIEILHPDFAWAGKHHSRAMKMVNGERIAELDLNGSFQRHGRSLSFFQAAAYGPAAAAEKAAKAVRAMHSVVKGVRGDGVPYAADNPETLRWAYATLAWGFATAHQKHHPRPLRGAALEEFYRQFTRVGEALGGTDLPAAEQEVLEYLKASVPELAISQAATFALNMVTPHKHPRPLRPFIRQFRWVVQDMAPDWLDDFNREPPPGRIENMIRRRVIRWVVNAMQYSSRDLREVRQSRERVKATAKTENAVA